MAGTPLMAHLGMGAMGSGMVRILGRPCTEGSGANPELLLQAGRGVVHTFLAQLMLGDTSPMGLLLHQPVHPRDRLFLGHCESHRVFLSRGQRWESGWLHLPSTVKLEGPALKMSPQGLITSSPCGRRWFKKQPGLHRTAHLPTTPGCWDPRASLFWKEQ